MAKKLDKADVVIVGVGWAGGIISAEMAKAGKKVVALERGRHKERSDYIGVKDELRFDNRYQIMQNLSSETMTSRNNIDETALPIRTRNDMQVGTDLGGGSVHWAGATYRYWPYEFEIRSKTIERYGKDKIPKDMNLQDWGITYEEMEKYYDKWEKTAGISGEQDPLAPKRKNPWPNPPLKETPSLKLFKDATKNLGLHPFQVAAGNMSEQYENPDGETLNACMYCSFCTRHGCDFSAKADPLATVIPTALKHDNYELRTRAYVRRVLYDKNSGKATGVLYVDERTGEEFEQPADVVVLSGFALTNNRLLMLSNIGEQYDPKTRKGLIGRNFNGQYNSSFNGTLGFFEDKKFNLYMGAGALGAAVNDYAADNFDHTDLDFIGGGAIELRQYGFGAISSSGNVPKGTPSWGKKYKENSLHYAYRALRIWYTAIAMSYWHNYLDLDPTYKDEYGDPLLRATYKFGDQERNIAKFGIDRCHEIMEEMGADIIEDDEVPEEFNHSFTGGHYTGGVVMGDDPETSAVNNYLQMWDVDNLFVVGGSAFPQFGGHHPTPTIGALSYRAAEGIEKYMDEGGQLAEAKRTTQKA
ncbi:Gluconate 2-dehydrogenase (acceptor) [Lentibacillus sp. JNUCC-1]|uniref:GMC family oxidoreductase n=1 Tax=Lentibacillus sp. JNUCC-1 TaxID=2654513 RepID=UPI0012E8DC16|nr:GMC family oxidoreductase [Lentibacillus sp. JNUCC-1]MUV37651.1 Gluconate 2-dehydrogenase (acceptor) [Lentibacillus sp. JNUCC-1]